MTCKDCIHSNVCDWWAVDTGMPFVNANTCDHYKNKANFVEVKHEEWTEINKYDKTIATYVHSGCTAVYKNFRHPQILCKPPKYCPDCGAKMDERR